MAGIRVSLLIVLTVIMIMTYPQYVGLHPVSATSPPNQGVAIWTRTENPSSGSDDAFRVAVDGTGIYVVGVDSVSAGSDPEWRIEKRSLGDGSVLWTQKENPSTAGYNSGQPSDAPRAVAVDATGVYVVGYDYVPGNQEWRIEKRSLSTGALTWTQIENPSTSDDEPKGIAVDGTGVYVVGYDQSPGNGEWRIEKRSLSTGALITTFGTGGVIREDPNAPTFDAASGVAVDGAGLYVVGDDKIPGDHEWRIEKRSLSTGALVTAFGTGGIVVDNPSTRDDAAYAVVVDGTGVYVVGEDQFPGVGDYEWRITKRQLSDGSLISTFGSAGMVQENPSSGDDEPFSAAIDGTGIYLAGYDAIPSSVDEWRIEKRDLGDGSPIWTQTENPSAGYDDAEGIAVNGTGVYVVGSDSSIVSDVQWRIEKRNPVLPGVWVVDISLVQGWNLISLPVVPVDSAPKIALATVMVPGNVTIVWSYTGTPTRSWKFFNPALTSGNTLTAVTDGLGLWVLMKAPGTVYVEGYVVAPLSSPTAYSLVAGWNLVGFKPVPDPSASETVGTYLTSLPATSYGANSVFIYDSPSGLWTRADSSTTLTPGHAFWIYMLAPATLTP